MNLKDWMKHHNLSIADLMKKTGYSRVSISRYRNGKIPPEDFINKVYTLSDRTVEPNSFYLK